MLVESRLEWLSTILARAIMRTVKNSDGAMEDLRAGQKVQLYKGDVEREVRYNPIAVSSALPLDIPEDFPIRNILIYLIPSNGSYASGSMTNQATLAAHVKIRRLPDGGPDFSDVYPRMKEILRHEIEHSTQDQKSAVGAFDWSDLERAERYFSDPKEVAAWVAGLYKRAKMLKQPFISMLDERLQGWRKMMMHRGKWDRNPPPDPVVVDAILRRIREKFIDYARHRFPVAQGI